MMGMEMLLKSMGLGEVIDMAKTLAENGTLQKILEFADKLDETNANLAKIAKILEANSDAKPGEAQPCSSAIGHIEPAAIVASGLLPVAVGAD